MSAGRFWARTPALMFAQLYSSNGTRGARYTINAVKDSKGNVIGPPTDPLDLPGGQVDHVPDATSGSLQPTG